MRVKFKLFWFTTLYYEHTQGIAPKFSTWSCAIKIRIGIIPNCICRIIDKESEIWYSLFYKTFVCEIIIFLVLRMCLELASCIKSLISAGQLPISAANADSIFFLSLVKQAEFTNLNKRYNEKGQTSMRHNIWKHFGRLQLQSPCWVWLYQLFLPFSLIQPWKEF